MDSGGKEQLKIKLVSSFIIPLQQRKQTQELKNT